jgi:hypothetical protein
MGWTKDSFRTQIGEYCGIRRAPWRWAADPDARAPSQILVQEPSRPTLDLCWSIFVALLVNGKCASYAIIISDFHGRNRLVTQDGSCEYSQKCSVADICEVGLEQ